MASSALKYTTKLLSHRVLILGGSTGIGYAVAEAAVESGADVIVSSSNQAKVDKAIARLQEHLKATGLPQREILGKTCDLADSVNVEENIKELLEFATSERTKLLDHVVFTAGDALKIQGLENVTIEDIHKTGMVRVTAAIMMAKHLSKYVNVGIRSSFTLTGGTMSWRPSAGWSVMAGIGGGVESLARGLAIDMKPVRVNCVRPGAVHTELFNDISEERLPGVLEVMRKDSLTGTVGTPEEVAEAYLFFMRLMSGFYNFAVLFGRNTIFPFYITPGIMGHHCRICNKAFCKRCLNKGHAYTCARHETNYRPGDRCLKCVAEEEAKEREERAAAAAAAQAKDEAEDEEEAVNKRKRNKKKN
ncbi:Fc.00g075140.m01.CDS01 [Cosmosporella sp. VM-42]